MEVWIADGRVSVNGKKAELGVSVGPQDHIRVDGRLLPSAQLYPTTTRVLVLNKPVGLIVTRNDPEGRESVFSLLPKGNWIAVGRLDINSAGLLLFTNNGDLAHGLMHPSRGIEREYQVRVMGRVSEDAMRLMREGVVLDDGSAAFSSIETRGGEGVNQWCRVTLQEGRKREVRRLFESQGLKVNRLLRVRYGPVSLVRGLLPGQWRDLETSEIAELMAAAQLQGPPPATTGKGKPRPKSKAKTQSKRGAKHGTKYRGKTQDKSQAKTGSKTRARTAPKGARNPASTKSTRGRS